jgi:outer membrane protein
MNSKLVLVSALAAGILTAAGTAQTATPSAPAAPAPAPTPTAPPLPQAVPAKVALIEFEQAAAATNEGRRAIEEIQKKYEPTKAKLDGQKTEIDSLTKQLQNAPATMTDEEKASRARTIDTKQKQMQRDADDAQTAYDADITEAVGKIEQKFGPVVIKYVQQNGYTMLLDNTGPPQQGGLSVLWAPGTDISQAVVDAYNATTPGVTAPAPSAPSAARPRPAAPKPGSEGGTPGVAPKH